MVNLACHRPTHVKIVSLEGNETEERGREKKGRREEGERRERERWRVRI